MSRWGIARNTESITTDGGEECCIDESVSYFSLDVSPETPARLQRGGMVVRGIPNTNKRCLEVKTLVPREVEENS